ncbi:uncharacterized protein K489DRAFT_234357 [Dissoconium aciculare CBS 342.82]|uniref:Uncharacterized protein n=1 Tax=Dissoconium aciculare CBS 342.82 TaxID=1314786 RepID=A0A6J3M3U9_9PEZI|nr:uncharacterized protein K489DRAFT_234357 [Dissoconium aciculare CBS 342.82]KAF1822154.1 hypothetical protein K489DRAFT_234357 [Dissoconium aciculare CBS 342.82]
MTAAGGHEAWTQCSLCLCEERFAKLGHGTISCSFLLLLLLQRCLVMLSRINRHCYHQSTLYIPRYLPRSYTEVLCSSKREKVARDSIDGCLSTAGHMTCANHHFTRMMRTQVW